MMNTIISFHGVTYRYPGNDENATQQAIFDSFTADIPGGFTCLTGPNGSGKTTFMLLAGGRLIPEQGNVSLCGIDTRQYNSEEQRNSICSFIYQNMEFETQEKTGTLLDTVLAGGAYAGSNRAILKECCEAFELDKLLGHSLSHLSKGEMQRVLLAFSILYGSRVVMMDEPMFAMEQYQKEKALEYLTAYTKDHDVSLYVSLHELSLARKYAENVLLFYPDRTIALGTADEVLTDVDLEKAYGIPAAMLKDKESLDRKFLIEQSQLAGGTLSAGVPQAAGADSSVGGL